MRTLPTIKFVILLSLFMLPLTAQMAILNTFDKNPIVFGEQIPELDEQNLASYMALVNPFDRKAPLYAQVEALITSKNGKQKIMKYEMFTMRDEEIVSVMIELSEPTGYKNTRMLITVPVEGGFPNVSIMMPFFLMPLRITELSNPMDFFLMDITSEDMNSRNTATDTYHILETVYANGENQELAQTVSTINQIDENVDEIIALVIEGVPMVKSDYERMVYYIDTKTMLSMKIEFFDKNNRKIKVLEVLETASPSDIVSATVLRMSDLKSGSNTLITYKELEYNVDVSQYITDQYLKKGMLE